MGPNLIKEENWTQAQTSTQGDTRSRQPSASPGARPGTERTLTASEGTKPAHTLISDFKPPEQRQKFFKGFPGSSAGKAPACNAGDPVLIPGSGRSPGEGIGYPLQYSWASLVAQLVKNPPAMQEILVQSLGLEDPLEKRKATHSNILAWRIPWTI